VFWPLRELFNKTNHIKQYSKLQYTHLNILWPNAWNQINGTLSASICSDRSNNPCFQFPNKVDLIASFSFKSSSIKFLWVSDSWLDWLTTLNTAPQALESCDGFSSNCFPHLYIYSKSSPLPIFTSERLYLSKLEDHYILFLFTFYTASQLIWNSSCVRPSFFMNTSPHLNSWRTKPLCQFVILLLLLIPSSVIFELVVLPYSFYFGHFISFFLSSVARAPIF